MNSAYALMCCKYWVTAYKVKLAQEFRTPQARNCCLGTIFALIIMLNLLFPVFYSLAKVYQSYDDEYIEGLTDLSKIVMYCIFMLQLTSALFLGDALRTFPLS